MVELFAGRLQEPKATQVTVATVAVVEVSEAAEFRGIAKRMRGQTNPRALEDGDLGPKIFDGQGYSFAKIHIGRISH